MQNNPSTVPLQIVEYLEITQQNGMFLINQQYLKIDYQKFEYAIYVAYHIYIARFQGLSDDRIFLRNLKEI